MKIWTMPRKKLKIALLNETDFKVKVKVIIADLLDILLKLDPTCRFFPLPTVTLDLPVQINFNDLQVVKPKISAELIGAFMVLMLST